MAWILPVAERLGAPGLAIIAFLDSSFLSLPQVGDALIVALTIQHPERWMLYSAATTLGSTAGCFVLYAIARKGGEAFLRRRFSEAQIERGLGLFRRHGLLAVIVPAMLPPPTPIQDLRAPGRTRWCATRGVHARDRDRTRVSLRRRRMAGLQVPARRRPSTSRRISRRRPSSSPASSWSLGVGADRRARAAAPTDTSSKRGTACHEAQHEVTKTPRLASGPCSCKPQHHSS